MKIKFNETEYIKEQLKERKFLKFPINNDLLLGFLEAKKCGRYERLIYKTKAGHDKSQLRHIRDINRLEKIFSKPFIELTQKDIIKLRDDLIEDRIKKSKTNIIWEYDEKAGKNRSHYEIVQTDKPYSYSTKMNFRANIVSFWKYVMEWSYHNQDEELPDITSYFIIPQADDYVQVKVDYIDPDNELQVLLDNIKNRKFKTLVQLCIMSGARPIEGINIKFGKSYNLYKNKEGKWVIHLPKIKRVSYAKFPFVIDMYEDELYPYFDNLKCKPGDIVFNMTSATFSKLMRHYTSKYLGKTYTPKILRKTARMIRTNAGYSHDWINKLMGHAPGSKVQAHYTNYEGVKNEPIANEKLKAQQYPSIKREYEQTKLKQQALEEQVNNMQKLLEALVKEKEIDNKT